MPKALFYFYNNTHAPLLLPVYRAMKNDSQWSIAFSFPKYDALLKEGFPPEEENRLRNQGVQIIDNPISWKADITITAEAVAHKLEGCGKLVNVGHGLVSKGKNYSNHNDAYLNNFFDLVCSPGPAFTHKLQESRQVFTNITETGMPKLDMLFAPNIAPRNELMRRLGKDSVKKTILYAPSWEIEFSSIPHFWTRIRQLANENTYLFIKLHGLTPREWIAPLRLLSEKIEDNIIFITDPDITPYLKLADVLITDVSSVVFEFMALDKPLILFDNQNIEEYASYQIDDIEYKYRDCGIRIQSFDELQAAVIRSMNNPGEFSEVRKRYSDELLIKRDHKSSQRVVDEINKLVSGNYFSSIKKNEITSVFMPIDGFDLADIEKTTTNLLAESGEDILVFFVGEDNAVEELINRHRGSCRYIKTSELTNPGSDYLAIIFPGVTGVKRWLFRLINHIRQSNANWGVVPMAMHGSPIQDPVQRFGYIPEKKYNITELDYNSRFTFTGEKFDILASVKPYCWVSQNNTTLANAFIDFIKTGKDIAGEAVKRTTIAKDVLLEFPVPAVVDPKEKFDRVDKLQISAAESRVNELSEWIGRILKPVNHIPSISSPVLKHSQITTPQKVVSTSTKNDGDISGHIRLARHFIKRGKLEKARDHIELGLAINQTDPDLLELASELNILK